MYRPGGGAAAGRVRLGGQGHRPHQPLRRLPLGGRRAGRHEARVRVPLRRVGDARRDVERLVAPGRPARTRWTIPAPDGRYLQWKVRMSGSTGAQLPVVRRVEAAYRNRNATPVVDSADRAGAGGGPRALGLGRRQRLRVSRRRTRRGSSPASRRPESEGSPRKLFRKGYRTLQWKATDPDGDTLVYELEFRPVGVAKWIPLRKDLRETFYSFDATSLPDGEYVFRVTASDAESNPGDAKTGVRESAPVRIDNTPPVIREADALDRSRSRSRPSTRPRRSWKPSTASTRRSGSRDRAQGRPLRFAAGSPT